MKKVMILAAFGFLAFNFPVSAQTAATNTTIAVVNEGERTPVKLEELPEPVKKTLASDAYKGWTASEAFLVKDKAEYYEISVKKEAETKLIKLNKEGVEVK